MAAKDVRFSTDARDAELLKADVALILSRATWSRKQLSRRRALCLSSPLRPTSLRRALCLALLVRVQMSPGYLSPAGTSAKARLDVLCEG